MTPSNPFQTPSKQHFQTPSTPSIGKGLGLGVVGYPFHLAGVYAHLPAAKAAL
jgi:hypothetical protein